jgi:murein DD-endopeptidase MepM/ murein hydrolase activator NlpD
MEKPNDADEQEIRRRLASIARGLPKTKPLDLDKPVRFKKTPIRKAIFWKSVRVMLCLLIVSGIFPPFSWPVRGNISSNFLFRFKPDSVILNIELHHGIDIAAPRGKQVSPTAIGVISEVGRSGELGNYVRIKHLLGFESVYAHLDAITVRKGAVVVPGLGGIGKVGATGRATGPHLHFGIFIRGVALPPKTMLLFHTARLKILGV